MVDDEDVGKRFSDARDLLYSEESQSVEEDEKEEEEKEEEGKEQE